MMQTDRRFRAQLVICRGCCCATARYPTVPIDRLKAVWKAKRLNKIVQLTISGCIGPCDVANVAQVVTASQTWWFGRLEEAHFDALLEWALACQAAERPLPLPDALTPHALSWPPGTPWEA